MENLENISESTHQELLDLANPLLRFMEDNGYHFFFVAGKDGVCTRHMRGSLDELIPILEGMYKKNESVKVLFKSLDL